LGETNSPSVAHVGYDISPLSRVKLKILTTRLFFVVLENGVAILPPSICGLIYCTRLVSSILIVKGLKLKYKSDSITDLTTCGEDTRHFNPLEDYRFFHHWFTGVKTP
jgi:hypothetical protein